MESFLGRFKNPLVLVIVVLLQTIALAVQVQRTAPGGAPDGPRVSALRYWTTFTVTPFERALHGGNSRVRNVWNNYIYLRNTRKQDAELRQEIARLRQEQAAFAEDAAQGRRLQALMHFQQQYIARTVAAQVIGSSGTDRSRVLWIDKGANDGLRLDQAVITPDGIVGKIRHVEPRTAQVLLINDLSAGAGVLLQSTRIRGILRGAVGGRIEINNLTSDSRIKPGEHVLTSGGDGVFPRGLPVGVIESIAADPEHQPYTAIMIKPAADLNRLEEVLVVTATQAELPSLAQQDADAASATAAESKRAAELEAERLPSAHEDEPKPDPNAPEQPAAQTAIPAVPRPKPTLHTDRYTPGATPPASSLRPGERIDQPVTPVRSPTGAQPETPPQP